MQFPACGPRPLGFYPIVDRASWLRRLLPLGVSTVQLRIKDLEGDELESELSLAVLLARHHRVRLFVNDHWEIATRLRAYGVHLGQEDLAAADLERIHAAGLRLGVSTHSPQELGRALEAGPSYVALGPVYPTTLKIMPWAPQGLERLTEWCGSAGRPVVAIGGITLERAPGVAACGADGIAVVSDVCSHKNPEERTRAWLAFERGWTGWQMPQASML